MKCLRANSRPYLIISCYFQAKPLSLGRHTIIHDASTQIIKRRITALANVDALYFQLFFSVTAYQILFSLVVSYLISYDRQKRNGCTLATTHKKIQHTLASAEKSLKFRVLQEPNKT